MSLSSDSLVSTKLRPSQARPMLVARPRLTATLEREPGRKLTLISAPAGFGKTTLLVEWLRERAGGEGYVAWVSLDEGDNDPVRFLSYLVAALRRTVGEGFGEGVLAALRSPEPPRMEAVLGAFVNELADLPGEVAVVLDDYHVIDSESAHRTVSFLLERLPEGAHIVISGRVDPPLPLARLRARGQMAELGAAELSFTPQEAAAFLKDVMGLSLSAEDIAALEKRTEGWIAGLQLAALSMRDRKDVSGFIESFSGTHRDVFDFLAEEVLERQPEHVREFLLVTSILGNLTGPLCDALTDRYDGDEMLEGLERNGFFVVALDDQRSWYRYHHLFADFLRGRLERERSGRIEELHHRACSWYERHGLPYEAVRHALSTEDHDRAAALVEQAVGETWFRGEVLTLLGWLEALPERAKRRRPRLLLEHATALMWVGRLEDVESLLREAERIAEATAEGTSEGPSSAGNIHRRYLLGYTAAIRAWRTNLMADSQGAIELAQRALELLPDDPRARSLAIFSLASAHRNAGDLGAASAAFEEAVELSQNAGHDYIALTAMGSLAHLRMSQGRLREAEASLQRALGFASERGAELLPAVGRVHIAMGELLYERDDLEAAARQLTEALEPAWRTGKFDVLVDGCIALSQVKQARGDAEGALEAAREADDLARRSGVDDMIVEAAARLVRLHLRRGDLTGAFSDWERMDTSSVSVIARETEQTTLARLLTARGEHDGALRLLSCLGAAAAEAGRRGSEIEILTLRALALRAKGEKEQATSTLAQALALAEPEGYVRTFVDEGSPMSELLSGVLEAQQRGQLRTPSRITAHYLRKLLAALEREAPSAAQPATELPEALSERELEVLQLIAAGKTNRQIASELFVSVGTVKTHINNVYRKLDAHSRTQALARARELNLI